MIMKKPIDIFIDNNVWDYFYKNNIDLKKSFPSTEYNLKITKEGEIEIDQIPGNKKHLKEYISSFTEIGYVKTTPIFGFYNDSLPKDQQRVRGFGEGVFTSKTENKARRNLLKYHNNEKRKPSQILYKNEADIELAARSVNYIVITFDKKRGPLKDAKDTMSGRVLFLDIKESMETTPNNFIKKIKCEVKKLAGIFTNY